MGQNDSRKTDFVLRPHGAANLRTIPFPQSSDDGKILCTKPVLAGDEFDHYVVNPRFGNRPRLTGLNPAPGQPDVYLFWRPQEDVRIPNTAVVARRSDQRGNSYSQITHYFDERRTCRECSRPFLFFADEQKFWYEALKFPFDADCVLCSDCRRADHHLRHARARYEVLNAKNDRTLEEQLELLQALLTLIESREFARSQIPHVRQLLNEIPDPNQAFLRILECRERLAKLESAPEVGI